MYLFTTLYITTEENAWGLLSCLYQLIRVLLRVSNKLPTGSEFLVQKYGRCRLPTPQT